MRGVARWSKVDKKLGSIPRAAVDRCQGSLCSIWMASMVLLLQ